MIWDPEILPWPEGSNAVTRKRARKRARKRPTKTEIRQRIEKENLAIAYRNGVLFEYYRVAEWANSVIRDIQLHGDPYFSAKIPGLPSIPCPPKKVKP